MSNVICRLHVVLTTQRCHLWTRKPTQHNTNNLTLKKLDFLKKSWHQKKSMKARFSKFFIVRIITEFNFFYYIIFNMDENWAHGCRKRCKKARCSYHWNNGRSLVTFDLMKTCSVGYIALVIGNAVVKARCSYYSAFLKYWQKSLEVTGGHWWYLISSKHKENSFGCRKRSKSSMFISLCVPEMLVEVTWSRWWHLAS